MRLVICHGEAANFSLLDKDGLKRPYHVVTMDDVWWEAAAEKGLPRLFFRNKLKMMRFCLGDHHLVCVTTRDGSDETLAVAASFHTMGAVDMRIYPD